ncbi:unnamed protein product [Kuraishia capsulata CBS 1993]|uniref:Uncharacterized protein n=1 Tax=Kuraishia capsulata CBS 1993 TaxID=1382522 RepID=W6MI55_9ASCO|nr:uncharacterized protein KUCA_T00002060001 [Kuraishia capsulata CBS 1993]CDK26089.1 unnamed protein product [Kuraishia capsulata CBS 1993]
MSFRGVKKALIRTPHQLLGRKSIEDRIIQQWEHDLHVSVSGLEFLMLQNDKWCKIWVIIMDCFLDVMDTFKKFHQPVGVLDEEDEPTLKYDETQLKSSITLEEIRQCEKLIRVLNSEICHKVEIGKESFDETCKEMKKHLENSLKLLKKRNHKKIDYDRYHNAVEKSYRSSSYNEKDMNNLEQNQNALDETKAVFFDLDDKVRLIIPQVLGTLSEFINKMSLKVYYQQVDIYEFLCSNMGKFVQIQGLAGSAYTQIINEWESDISQTRANLESMELLKDFKPFQSKSFLDKTASGLNTGAQKLGGLTGAALTKTLHPHQKLNLKHFKIENPVVPFSDMGMFENLNLSLKEANPEELDEPTEWLKPYSLSSDQAKQPQSASMPSTPNIRGPAAETASPKTPQTPKTPSIIGADTEKFTSKSITSIEKLIVELSKIPPIEKAPAISNKFNFDRDENVRDFVLSRMSITSTLFG